MAQFDLKKQAFVGSRGTLVVREDDEITRKLAMLVEGECDGTGPAEVVRQVIRHRFLDPDASAEVIAQKLSQVGSKISVRSVERVIEDFGLQKKTLPMPAKR